MTANVPRCLGCGARVEERDQGSAGMDVCATCGGVSFDAGELLAHLRRSAARAPVDRPAAQPAREAIGRDRQRCGRCNAARLRHWSWHGAAVTRCDQCKGTYVGPDALATLMAQARVGSSWEVLKQMVLRRDDGLRGTGTGRPTAGVREVLAQLLVDLAIHIIPGD
jgi:Zn-finger nucleic acid-binding protein